MPLLRVKRHMVAISSPGMQGIAELNQLNQACLLEFPDHAEQVRRQLAAPFLVEMFFQQQRAEPLFEAVDRLQCRVLGEISREPPVLIVGEVMAVPAHQ